MKHLDKYIAVEGELPAAPLDMPERFNRAMSELQADGWRVVVKDIGTDFTGPLGIPVPKSQPIKLLLWREGGTVGDARLAVIQALEKNTLASAVSAWLSEIAIEVVQPTIEDAKRLAVNWGPIIIAGAVGVAALIIFLRK